MNEDKTVLNVNAFSSDWRAYALANFPLFPFVLDGVTIASVEGFVQGIKLPPENPLRQKAFLSHSHTAKQFGEAAARVHVWWGNQVLPYGSPEHHELIARGIRAKFFCNGGLQIALRATEELRLIHDLGHESPTTSLPASVFCQILTSLRTELLLTGKIAEP